MCDHSQAWFWRKLRIHLSVSSKTSIRIITLNPNLKCYGQLRMQIFDNITFHWSYIMWKQINNTYRDILTEKCDMQKKIRHDFDGNHDLISPYHGKHPSESSGIYWCIYQNPVSEKIISYFTSYKQQEFLLLLNLYLVLPSWYIISALLLQHLAHQQSPI